ncbi:MAG: pantoate--beta-alanine ligase [Rhodocyclaceae bacterium]|nr:pantoate--beta-alanine ligase [Rhodocyclaceae bacterium]
MKIFHEIAPLRATLRDAGRVVLVPTMGNLHEGHIRLMHDARKHGDKVVATVFVNRLQFRPGEDFDKYPRTLAADAKRLEDAGVEYLFAPSEDVMYPTPQYFHVDVPDQLATILEGEFRPGHFRGVATVVMKLFQIVQPDAALFGKKDYQQMLVLSGLVREFNLPIEVIAGDTIRAEDGLALSSRNGFLSASERQEAPRLHRLLMDLVARIQAGERDFAKLEAVVMDQLRKNGWSPDYVAVRRRADLQVPLVDDPLVVVAAAKLGTTRLIDNVEI